MWYKNIKTTLHDINGLKGATAVLALLSSTAYADTVDCSSIAEWQSGVAYHGGTQVQLDNKAYEAK